MVDELETTTESDEGETGNATDVGETDIDEEEYEE